MPDGLFDLANSTGFPERIAISGASLVNKGWIHGAGEDLVLFLVEVKARTSGYLTLSPLPDVLWIREFYLDGRTWRGAPKGDSFPILHRGLGKLILAYLDEQAQKEGRSLGVFTTRSLGLLKACDHLFGDRCQYVVADGDPPQTLYRQRGLRWLPFVEQYSAIVPGLGVLLFQKKDEEYLDDRVVGQVFRLAADEKGTMSVRDLNSGRSYGPEDGLLVSIGPSVDILVLRPAGDRR